MRLQAACLNLPLISFKTSYRWIQKDSDSSKVRSFKGYGKYLRLKWPGKVFSRRTKSAVRYLPDLPDIDDRPGTNMYSHWECDLIHGHRYSGYILTAVERKSGFLMAAFFRTRNVECVSSCLK